MDADLQQRAAEYLALGQRPDVAARNVTAMPPWEKRKSLLLRRMAEREARLRATRVRLLLRCVLWHSLPARAAETEHWVACGHSAG